MLAEDIRNKINTKSTVELTRMERSYLMTLLARVIAASNSNSKYYRINESMKNRKTRWTEDDTKYLIDAYHRGETDKQISEALARTLKGVERKRDKLGLKHY